LRACRRICSEGVNVIGSSEKKDILMKSRSYRGKRLTAYSLFELDDLEKMIIEEV